MKFAFGLVSLLVVVAIVALVARQQMHAAPAGLSTSPATAQSARQIEQRVGADVQKALDAGQARNEAAERAAEGKNP